MSSDIQSKNRTNIALAVVLGLVALGFYVGFIWVTANG